MPVGLREIESAGLGLTEFPGEGRCLTANRRFAAGEVLLAERPLVRPSSEDAAREIQRDPSRFSLLRGSENHAAKNVKDAPQPFLVEVETNSFMFGGQVVVFHAFSMLNHACATSEEEKVCFSILNTGDVAINDELEVKLVATRDILPGEAIRISYHELLADAKAKEEQMHAHCGGPCGCSVCCLQGAEDMRQLGRVLSEPAMCQHCGGGLRTLREGDLVSTQGLTTAIYNQLHGRIKQTRKDGRFLVAAQFGGVEKQLWLKSEHLVPLEGTSADLQRCGRCKSVSFCSRECQRAGWKEHKPFCCEEAGPSWEAEHATLALGRRRFDDPSARQDAPTGDLLRVFADAERFVQKWTQLGRSRRPAPGHRAVQQMLAFAIPMGTLALWRSWTDEGALDAGLWARVAVLAKLHLHHIRALVPRFHIAHWTALHHVWGLLSFRDLAQMNPAMAKRSADLAAEFEGQLDVARVYMPEVAVNFRKNTRPSPDMDNSAQLFQMLAQDPLKLQEFYSIDPSLPMEQKMERMARLVDPTWLGGSSGSKAMPQCNPKTKPFSLQREVGAATLSELKFPRQGAATRAPPSSTGPLIEVVSDVIVDCKPTSEPEQSSIPDAQVVGTVDLSLATSNDYFDELD